MASSKTHTAESWASILLRNTHRLTDVKEQEKFWRFLANPDDAEDIPEPVLGQMEHTRIEEPKEYTTTYVSTEEEKNKEEEVVIVNEYFRNGQAMYIRSKPVSTSSSTSEPSPVDRDDLCEGWVEKIKIETSSDPSEQSEQKLDTISSTC